MSNDAFATVVVIAIQAFTKPTSADWCGYCDVREAITQYLSRHDMVDAHMKDIARATPSVNDNSTIRQSREANDKYYAETKRIKREIQKTWVDYCAVKFEKASTHD